MRVIVCGGRMFGRVSFGVPLNYLDNLQAEASAERDMLARVLDQHGIAELAEGGAKGADELARQWAASRGVPVRTFEAHWHLHDKAAGGIRNQRMLDEFKPDAVIAFPGGKGTADMVRRATAAGVRVIEVEALRDAAGRVDGEGRA